MLGPYKNRTLLFILLLSSLFLFNGCRKKGDYSGGLPCGVRDCDPPTIVSVSPVNGGQDVPLNTQITATFNEAMEPATLSTSTFVLSEIGTSGTMIIQGTVTYTAGSMTATFIPSADLSPQKIYSAKITTGVEDIAMNNMAALYTWSFTTGVDADLTPPQFLGDDPQLVASATSSNSISLSWTAATDNVTPQNQLKYVICQSTVSTDCTASPFPPVGGNVVFYETVGGITQLGVAGLTNSTTYYFVVRAKDSVGLVSTNTGQKSATTFGTWVQKGANLNNDPNKIAKNPSIGDVGGVSYLAWGEGGVTGNDTIYVRTWNEALAAWSATMAVNTPGSHGLRPFIASNRAATPTSYLAYTECSAPLSTDCKVVVKKWDGAAWVAVGAGGGVVNSDANQYAVDGALAFDSSGTPYIAWAEKDATSLTYQIYVKKFDGANWTQVGGSLNVDPTNYNGNTPSIAINGSSILVSWVECKNGNPSRCFLYVKSFDGINWTPSNPTPLQVSTNISGIQLSDPKLVFISSIPHLAWHENPKIYVKKFTNNAWTLLGDIPDSVFYTDFDTSSSVSPIPYAAFTNLASQPDLIVKRWNESTSAWVVEGNGLPLNVISGGSASQPSIGFSGGVPYVAWTETGSGYPANAYQIFVKRLE